MSARTFRTLRQLRAPRWLTEGEGGLVGYSLDLIKDTFLERVRLGRLAHFPQQDPSGTPAPRDALLKMAHDRRVFPAISETDAELAERLLPWLDKRVDACGPLRLLRTLKEYVGPLPALRTVDDNGNWFSLAADGTESWLLDQRNWNWDGKSVAYVDGGTWSRFWVIIYPNGLWTEGDGGWNDTDEEPWNETANADGSPLGWGATITIEQVATLRAIVRDQLPGGMRCVNIILAFDSNSFDPTAPEPDGTWGTWTKPVKVAGVLTSEPSRLSTARYLDGVGVS